jgi:hypothetical protein
MIPGQMYSIGVVGIGYDSPSMLEIGGIPRIRATHQLISADRGFRRGCSASSPGWSLAYIGSDHITHFWSRVSA